MATNSLANHPRYSLVYITVYTSNSYVIFEHEVIREPSGDSRGGEIIGIESFEIGRFESFEAGLKALALQNQGHALELAISSVKVY